jgi:hypothetical protein
MITAGRKYTEGGGVGSWAPPLQGLPQENQKSSIKKFRNFRFSRTFPDARGPKGRPTRPYLFLQFVCYYEEFRTKTTLNPSNLWTAHTTHLS